MSNTHLKRQRFTNCDEMLYLLQGNLIQILKERKKLGVGNITDTTDALGLKTFYG